MEIKLDDIVVKNAQTLPLKQAQGDIEIKFTSLALKPQTYSTFLMYDISAPYPEDPTKSPLVHYLMRNIPGRQLGQGEEIFEYHPPNPPEDSRLHTYVCEIYLQKGWDKAARPTQRTNFDLADYIEKHRLNEEAFFRLTFKTAKQLEAPLPNRHALNRSVSPKPVRGRTTTTSKAASMRAASPSWAALIQDPSDKFRADSQLEGQEKKSCSCVVDVAAKQTDTCLRDKAWKKTVDGKKCANPYAICAKSTGTTSRRCDMSLDFNKLSDDQIRAMALLKGIPVDGPFDRQEVINHFNNKTRPASPQRTQRSTSPQRGRDEGPASPRPTRNRS